MKNGLLTLIGLFFLSTCTFAQQHFCGTAPEKSEWLKQYQKNPSSYSIENSSDTLFLPVTVHIVGTNGGGGYFPLQTMLKSFCTLNGDFKASKIQFYIEGEVNYINNTEYYDHDWSAGFDMMFFNNVPNTINCYIVDSPAGNCGYYSGSADGVALAKSCTGPSDHTWAHEIGHFLSLPHPFVGWEGFDYEFELPAPFQVNGNPVELLDGSNCAFAGDGFCDTPPDYLSFRWNCNAGDISDPVLDPTGAEFEVDGTLFMSYSNDGCMNRFSDEQIDAMRANVQFARPNLLNTETPYSPITDADIFPLYPEDAEFVPTYDNITFEWEPVVNADWYYLEIALDADFDLVLYKYLVESSSFTTLELKKNRDYYWRVTPFNNQYTCDVEPSTIFTFQTGEVTNVKTIESINNFKVFPNPIDRGQSIILQATAESFTSTQVMVTDASGKQIISQAWDIGTGNNNLEIETSNLESGIYIVSIVTEEGVINRRIAVY